jgi:beta-lactamase class A
VFLVDLDTGAYLDLNGASTLPSASLIKVPVLVAFFQDVDAGKIRLDEQLTMRPEMIGTGSGDMQFQAPGTKFTALQTATQMITISDNTATNMLIARLGGPAALNQRFQSWGLTSTVIRTPLPDLQGTNTTSPKELVSLMALVNQGELMSLRSRDRLLDIMRHTVTNSLLPQGLGEGATIAHKTGDIGSLLGDVGIIDMPSGKRYILAAMVKRPFNDYRAQELIRQISRAAYKTLSQPVAVPGSIPAQLAPSQPGNQPPAAIGPDTRPAAPAEPANRTEAPSNPFTSPNASRQASNPLPRD